MSITVNQSEQSYDELISSLDVHKVKTTPGQVVGKIFTYIGLIAYSLFSLLPLYGS